MSPDDPGAARLCAVCGTRARPVFRTPQAEQAPDLDGRPGEPLRSTLPRWLQTCPGCSAAGPDLAALPDTAAGIVRSPAYAEIRPPLPAALPFLRWAMLGPPAQRAETLLQAAWTADDAAHFSAARLRIAAVDAWGEPATIESALRLVDVLRRAGDMARAAQRAARLEEAGLEAGALEAGPLDENAAAILAFQRARIAAGDARRHLISSALRPPARMPHVSHGKRAKSGFWQRLFGG